MDHSLIKQLVLQRYQFPSLKSGVTLSGKDPDFIATLIKAFEDDGTFNYQEFEKFSLEIIVDYIRRTHKLYLNKSLQEIEQSIALLNEAYATGHPLLEMLNEFFLDYKTELILHIREEDQLLIPHILYLETAISKNFNQYDFFIRQQSFTIDQFLANHEDNDMVLEEVRDKILTYDPPVVNQFVYHVLLNQLEFFGHDLKVHGMIEDQVLLPRALALENMLAEMLTDTAMMN